MNITSSFDDAEELLDSPAEEATLISALLSVTSRHLLPDILPKLSADDFYDPHLGEVWAAARGLSQSGKSVSKRTLLAERDTPAIRDRLKALAGEPVRDAQVHEAVAAVSEMSRRRQLLVALKRAAEQATRSDSYSEALHFASEQLSGLSEGGASSEESSFAEALDRWQEWASADPTQARVIPTPWDDMNDILAGGLHAGRTYIAAARPGEGKSLLGANLAAYAAERGYPAAVFSVEMGEGEVVSRILAAQSRAEYGQITRRNIDEFNWGRIAEYIDGNRNMPLTIVDKSDVTVEYIAARCRTLKRTQGLDVVFVDYLQLLRESDSRVARERQVAQMSRALKILARELDIAIVIACQLNRNSVNADRKPVMADLRESGSIEQDCDVGMLLFHEKGPGGEPTGMVTVILGKNRTGRCGEVVLPWRAHQARIG